MFGTMLGALLRAFYSPLALSLMIAAISAGTTWKIQDWRHEAEITAIEKRYTEAAIKAANDAWTIERGLHDAIYKADQQRIARERRLRGDAAGAVRAADGLRDEIARLRASNRAVPAETVVVRADTAQQLLGDCATEYRAVAEKADRHASDAKMMFDAWPVGGVK